MAIAIGGYVLVRTRAGSGKGQSRMASAANVVSPICSAGLGFALSGAAVVVGVVLIASAPAAIR